MQEVLQEVFNTRFPFFICSFSNSSCDNSKAQFLSPRSVSAARLSPRVDLPVGIAEFVRDLRLDCEVKKDSTASVTEEPNEGTLADLPSPPLRMLSCTTDVAVSPHGVPPRPLYARQAVSTLGSSNNPRIVSRRRASVKEPLVSKGGKADHHTSSLVPALPLKFASSSAPSSPQHSNASSPRLSKIPILRAISSTLSTLRLGLLSSTSSHSRSSDSDSNGEAAERSLPVSLQAEETSYQRYHTAAVQAQAPGLKPPISPGLRLPWPIYSGASKGRISPSVSTGALDELELELRPFEP